MKKKVTMSPTAFKRWLKAQGYTHSEAARKLGVCRQSVSKYSKEGAPALVQMACDSLARE